MEIRVVENILPHPSQKTEVHIYIYVYILPLLEHIFIHTYIYIHTYIPIRTHTLHIFFYCRYGEEKNGILLFEGLEISNLVRSILNSQSITLKYFRDKKNITTLIFRRKLWIATRCEHFAFLNDISVSWTIGMIIIHSYKVS